MKSFIKELSSFHTLAFYEIFQRFLLIKNHLMFHRNISGKFTIELRMILQKSFQPVVWIYDLLLSGRWMIYIIMFNPSCVFICDVNRVEEFQALNFFFMKTMRLEKSEKNRSGKYICLFHCSKVSLEESKMSDRDKIKKEKKKWEMKVQRENGNKSPNRIWKNRCDIKKGHF